MTTYIVTDAPGYCGDWATIYSTHASADEAIADAEGHTGRAVIQDEYDQYTAGERVPAHDLRHYGLNGGGRLI